MEFCTRVSNQLMLNMIEQGKEENIVTSPLSINVVLNMVAAGAKGGALNHMLRMLGSKNVDQINSESSKMLALASGAKEEDGPVAEGGVPSNNAKDGPTVAMVNGIWVDERFPLAPSYAELVRGVYKCEAKTVDIFHKATEVESEINSWTNAASRGLIKKILQRGSLKRDTAIVLANGLYFKGLWKSKYKFDARRTEERIFYLSNGNTVRAPFMTSRKEYNYGSFDGFKVLSIPYQGGNIRKDLSMYFFLPNEKDGLKNLVGKFSKNPLFLHKNLKLKKVPLETFWIPKFKFTFEYDVGKVMNDAGAPLTFLQTPKDWADMMHIPEGVPFMIPTLIQKACVEVDEKGTEAAAITSFGIELACRAPPKVEGFVADHPFMFVIKEETSGLILFTGAVLNPNSN